MVHDFTIIEADKSKEFYDRLEIVCQELHQSGGLGILINNVGIANEIPMRFDEFDTTFINNIINCNIFSTIYMTRTVMKFMKLQNRGAILSISSGSGNAPGPFLAIYSSTKFVYKNSCNFTLNVSFVGHLLLNLVDQCMLNVLELVLTSKL